MLIDTHCPHCDSVLKAPESVLGKRVRCKKCNEIFVARRDEDAEEADESPAPKKTVKLPASAPSRRRDEDDTPARKPRAKSSDRDAEDGDDDAPARPKKKKGKKKKKAETPVMLFVLVGVGALLLLGGGGVGVYYGFIKEDKPTTPTSTGGGPGPVVGPGVTPGKGSGGPAASTDGWVEITEPAGQYKIKFPTQPQSQTLQQQTPFGPVPLKVHLLQGPTGVFIVTHQNIPDRGGLTDDQLLEQAMAGGRAQAKGATMSAATTISHQGYPGREATLSMPGKQGGLVLRAVLAGNRIIVMTAGGDNASASSPQIKAFFDSLVIEGSGGSE